MTQVDDWIGRKLCGKYVIDKVISAGGFGTAYLARDRNMMDDPVVVKIPHQHAIAIPEVRKRFAREIRTMAKNRHNRIVHIRDVGDLDGYPFYIMDYLPGGTLSDYMGSIDRAGGIEVQKLVEWLQPVAEALDFLHAKGIVHRDVKPDNILFDHMRYTYLGDLGIVKSMIEDSDDAERLTRTGTAPGTLPYMAPEQLNSKACGQTDQYSLAVVCYEVLAGQLPFSGDPAGDVASLYKKILLEDAPALHDVASQVSKPVSDVVHRGLHKKSSKRFETCLQFVEAVAKATKTAAKKRPAPSEPVNNPELTRASCPNCGAYYFFEKKEPAVVSCMVCNSRINPDSNSLIGKKETSGIKQQVKVDTSPSMKNIKPPKLSSQNAERLEDIIEVGQKGLKESQKVAKVATPILYAIAVPRFIREFIAGPQLKKGYEQDKQNPNRRGHDEPEIADSVNIVFLRIVFWGFLLFILFWLFGGS